ncbi:MAG: 2-amino-3,7-dideoxy-D-threo-hept-6-ulosonate synthase [archaeon]
MVVKMMIDANGHRKELKKIVVKIGGSVLSDDESVMRQAKWIKKIAKDVETLHVVVSAKKGVTDCLVEESRAMSDKNKAVHQIQGEIESAKRLTEELKKIGVDSKLVIQGTNEYPLVAKGDYLEGMIDLKKSKERIHKLDHRLCVIAGYGAETEDGDIVLLGRNSTDLVAAAIANLDNADAIIYLKDTHGVLRDVCDKDSTISHISVEVLKRNINENKWEVLHPKTLDFIHPNIIGIVQKHTQPIGKNSTIIHGGVSRMIGKTIRIERILNRDTGKTVIIPLDHGVTIGPCDGLLDMGKTVDKVAEGGANAVLGHVGLPLHGHRGYGRDVGLILHLSSSTTLAPDPNTKVLTGSVEQAIKMGADAVSVHVNVGALDESKMLSDLGAISQKCMEWGMPLLAMMYPRGPNIKNPHDVAVVKHAVRIAAELGVDIIKTNYTGDAKSFKEVVDGAMGVPVVIAGGAKGGDLETLKMVEGAIRAGGAGVAMGRNAFQHENPVKLVRAVCAIVHEGKSAEEAMKIVMK